MKLEKLDSLIPFGFFLYKISWLYFCVFKKKFIFFGAKVSALINFQQDCLVTESP